MYEYSKWKIRIDFGKSHGSYIYNQTTRKEYLDLFGMFASLPLGYNHESFFNMSIPCMDIKIPNCEIITTEAISFLKEFKKWTPDHDFFHFTCTGSLAIESAIKTAMAYKCMPTYYPKIILSLDNSFHGINGYGHLATHGGSKNFVKLPYKEIIDCIKTYEVVAVIVEPIQSTAGDLYFPKQFFTELRDVCDKRNVTLIFDEIQTGFGSTGTMWYYQQLGIIPDIVAFGKKAQVSGIMAKKKYQDVFNKNDCLSATWDGNLIDMIRCEYILKAYKKHNILANVKKQGKFLLDELKKFTNARGCGLMLAFDLKNKKTFIDCASEEMIFNQSVGNTIRLRPNLAITRAEAREAVRIIKNSIKGK